MCLGKHLVVLLVLVCATSVARAQYPSLATGDQDEVSVKIRGTAETFTVFRDAFESNIWYYVPNAPRLFERTFQGQKEPEFSLIGYQFADPKKAGYLLEGGLLQFAASLAIQEKETQDSICAAIAEKRKKAIPPENINAGGIRLSAMPIKSAEVSIYTPEGEFLSGKPKGEGIAPLFATQKMVFSVPLSKIGTAVFEEIVNGNTGVPVVVNYKFSGVTPPARGKVEVDYKRAHEHYSTEKIFAARASYFGLFGGSADITSKSIFDTLKEKKVINVEFTENEGMKFADFEKILQPILTRINNEILEATKPPEKIDTAKAAKPGAGGRFFSAGYSQATVRANYAIEKKEIIDFKFRQCVERATVASGFIGIGEYNEELRKKLVTLVASGPFKAAYFVLPEVGEAPEVGITQVEMQVTLATKKGKESQLRIWTQKDGWTVKGAESSKLLAFPLGDLARKDPSLKDMRFVVETTVRMGGKYSAKAKDDVKVVSGEFAIAPPLESFDIIEVNAGACSWQLVDPDKKPTLRQIDVALKMKDDKVDNVLARVIKPYSKDGKDLAPKSIFFIVPKRIGDNAAGAIEATITFQVGNERFSWEHNGCNLREFVPSLALTLNDDDVRKAKK